MNFKITDTQLAQVQEWLERSVYPKVIEEQKNAHRGKPVPEYTQFCWDDGYPYQGAIGGGTTYSFTPNSIGCTIKVSAYGQELDISEYDKW